jgi:RNA polymerase sigma factor (sigma-70 family)
MVHDAELLRRYVDAKSEPALTEFVRRHFNVVYFTALRSTRGNSALAEEIAQAVFTATAQRARMLSTHPTVTGWLYTTTRHVAARATRQEMNRQRHENAATVGDALSNDPGPAWEQLRPLIDDALQQLDARQREAILLRFFEGQPFAEIGAAWRVSEDAARMRVDRALDKLRVVLRRRGVTSVSAALSAALMTQAGLSAPSTVAATVTGAAIAAAAPTADTSFLSIMTGTKFVIGTAALAVALATGTAVINHQRAKSAELRLDEASRQLAAVRAQLSRAQQRGIAMEKAAAEAEKDSGALLAAVQAARAKPDASTTRSVGGVAARASSPGDPLAQTLDALFPTGIVATVNDRSVTVEDVRREMTPLLAKLVQDPGTPEQMRHRLYALQNTVIGDLVTRQLNIQEFALHAPAEQPKHIPAETIDAAIADRLKEQFNNDQSRFAAALTAQGVTLAQYRQQVADDIIYSYMRAQQRRATKPEH